MSWVRIEMGAYDRLIIAWSRTVIALDDSASGSIWSVVHIYIYIYISNIHI